MGRRGGAGGVVQGVPRAESKGVDHMVPNAIVRSRGEKNAKVVLLGFQGGRAPFPAKNPTATLVFTKLDQGG